MVSSACAETEKTLQNPRNDPTPTGKTDFEFGATRVEGKIPCLIGIFAERRGVEYIEVINKS
ncbi:hypothetical protein BH09BAC3_BH09BAC3_37210 [soil metagenome]